MLWVRRFFPNRKLPHNMIDEQRSFLCQLSVRDSKLSPCVSVRACQRISSRELELFGLTFLSFLTTADAIKCTETRCPRLCAVHVFFFSQRNLLCNHSFSKRMFTQTHIHVYTPSRLIFSQLFSKSNIQLTRLFFVIWIWITFSCGIFVVVKTQQQLIKYTLSNCVKVDHKQALMQVLWLSIISWQKLFNLVIRCARVISLEGNTWQGPYSFLSGSDKEISSVNGLPQAGVPFNWDGRPFVIQTNGFFSLCLQSGRTKKENQRLSDLSEEKSRPLILWWNLRFSSAVEPASISEQRSFRASSGSVSVLITSRHRLPFVAGALVWNGEKLPRLKGTSGCIAVFDSFSLERGELETAFIQSFHSKYTSQNFCAHKKRLASLLFSLQGVFSFFLQCCKLEPVHSKQGTEQI